MKRVFISYRHTKADASLAKFLHGFLKDKGYDAFLDTEIRPGNDWAEVIEGELRRADVFILFLSAEAITSDFIRVEVELASELSRRANKPLRIIPVRLNFTEQLPYVWRAHLDSIQYLLWKPGVSREELANQLIAATENGDQLTAEPSAGTGQSVYDATEAVGIPLPAAEPEMESGTLRLDSAFYVRRGTDDQAETLADRQGSTLIIKGPRQIGKSSLLARLHARAKDQECLSFYLDFQLVDQSQLGDLNKLFNFMAKKIQRTFHAPLKPKDVWDEDLGPTDNLTDYIEDALLSNGNGRFQILLDEVDRIFQCDFRDDFFAAIRGWHNRRATSPSWNRLNLVIGHSTAPALWIQDINQSPFNVGDAIRLADFGIDELATLNGLYGGPLQDDQLPALLKLTGGHPYLVRVALHTLSVNHNDLSDLQENAHHDDGPFADHLHAVVWSLREDEGVKSTLRDVIRKGNCQDEYHFQRLLASGLARGESRNRVGIRCGLYRDYLQDHI